MIRQRLVPRSLRSEPYFRWRGGDVSRIEALTDMVFAFSLTLLVVSLQVPATFDEMAAAFRQFPAFAVCFLILVMAWYAHYQYHRRYGFEDFPTLVFNTALLFVILFYVYPLKFLFTFLFNQVMNVPNVTTLADGSSVRTIRGEQVRPLMLFYSSGVILVFGLFSLMYLYAWRKRGLLELDEVERLVTRSALRSHLISMAIGALSLILALAYQPELSGMIYFLMPVAHGLHGWRSGVAVQRLARARDVAVK